MKACGLLLLALATGTATLAQSQPGAPLWSYNAGYPIGGAPAVAGDGSIYFTVGYALCAVTNRGSNKWIFPLDRANHGGYSAAAIGADGTIFVSSGYLYAFNPDGSQKWAYPANSENGSPAIGRQNEVYIHGEALLYSLSAGGTLVWSNRIGGSYFYGSPSIAPNQTVYAPNPENMTLFTIGPDGGSGWQANLPSRPADTTAIGADGTLYTTAAGLYAFSASGDNLWVNTTNLFVDGCPVVGKDGTIYVATWGGGSLYAMMPTGVVKWRATLAGDDTTNAPVTKCPAIDSAGMIYYAVFHTLYAITPQGGVQWTFTHPGDTNNPLNRTFTSPTIGPDGTIYVTFGSTLYAIYNTNKLADSPWPMYRQNARHTGKIEKPLLQQPKKRADANFQFQLYAQLGGTDTVLTSTDLSCWSALTDVVVTNVPMDVVDLSASNYPSRFYRVRSP